MEEITAEKIKARIKENLKRAREQNFAANMSGKILESASESNNITKQTSIKKKIIRFGLNYKHIIKSIPVLNIIAKKLYLSLAYNRIQDPIRTNKKTKKIIRRVYFFRYPLWWIYMIVKAPTKIRELFSEVNKLRSREEAFEETLNQLLPVSQDRKILQPAVLMTEGYLQSSHKVEVLHNDAILASGVHAGNCTDAFYYRLENVFRGSMEEIKQRQSVYLPYVTEAHTNSRGKYFLDVGCGRGEFLSLLRDHGIPARGVDINRVTTDLARKKWNVDIILSDALEYLNSLEDNSVIGISLFQVIEHFDFKYINAILETARKKIALNGIIILESANPYCPVVSGSFYLDPTHNRPCPHYLIEFMLLWHDFENIKIIYSSPAPGIHFKQAFMNYQDYAAVGRRLRL